MKTIKYLGIALLASTLTACFDDNKLPTPPGDNSQTEPPVSEVRLPYKAVIATGDYSSAEIQVADINGDNGSTLSGAVFTAPPAGFPDFTVSSFGDYFYHIGRYGIDTITKHHIDAPETNVWGNARDAKGEEGSGNSYELVSLSEEKAYLIRYDSDKVWIVNPSAADEANFKIGELDLSAYTVAGNTMPNAIAGKIIGDKLFVLMQRLDNWCATEDAYIAVFDTKTNTEVKTGTDNAIKGIQLQVRNPSGFDFQEDIGLVVNAIGGGSLYCNLPDRYIGGVERIRPGSYVTDILIDDENYDFVTGAVILDKNNGYFSTEEEPTNFAGSATKLYHFNPRTLAVSGVVNGFNNDSSKAIRVLQKTPENTAWVGIAGDSSFAIINAKQEVEEEFSLLRDPQAVAFSYQAAETDNSIQPPFAPKAGEEGSTAIAADDPSFVAWATGYENYLVGTEVLANWQTPEQALGYPGNSDGTNKGTTYDIVVLGRDGEITLTFDKPIKNGEGADFAVFENSFSDTFLELAWVEVSSDGKNFYRFPNYSFTANPVAGFGNVDPTMIHNLAGKYKGGYGTPFDLEDLKDVEGLNINRITHVKLIDIVGNGTALDSLGNIIYEPYPTVQSAGFDLDAVGVIHQAD